ncbi:MAG: hypothetical protein FWH03_05295 [Firmicutes bacterium]|nr:hypothetical protein [Bacillota bacterium]
MINKISANREALSASETALHDLKNSVGFATSTLRSSLDNFSSGLDDGLKIDAASFFTVLEKFDASIIRYADENMDAIAERIKKMDDYSGNGTQSSRRR